MNNNRLTYLLTQWLEKGITPAEEAELAGYLQAPEYERFVQDDLQQLLQNETGDNDNRSLKDREQLITNVLKIDKSSSHVLPAVHRVHLLKRSWFRMAAAAILILAIGLGIYYLNPHHSKSDKSRESVVKDIAPGSDKAIWILADGKQIELDSTVLDMTSKKESSNENGYNELRTPRGGQYQLILPDGSKVWLNAASSIRYPVLFSSNERRVEVTGEAYFEVFKDAHKPFKVYSDKQEIEVLGTSFNVQVYNEEPATKITLVEGSIKVADNILKPGQAYSNGKIIQTNIDQDLAWKNDVFNFTNMDLAAVLRQLARWYDVDVQFEGTPSTQEFSGELSRKLPLSKVLELLNELNVQLKIEGRTLIVKNHS